MADVILRCANCHRQFEIYHTPGWISENYGSFCSWECHQEYQQKKEDRLRNEAARRNTGLAAGSVLGIIKQSIDENRAQQQAQAQAAAEQAKLLREYGFNNVTDAKRFIQEAILYHNCSEDDDLETKLQKAEIEHKEYLERKKEYNAKLEQERKEREKEIKKINELISSLMNEEQKQKYAAIENFSKKSIDKSPKILLLMVLFPVLWIIAYKLFLERFLYWFGFWSSLIAFIGLGGIIIYFLGISSTKMKINKIAKIKGNDSFPFYSVSSVDFGNLSEIDFGYLAGDLAFRNGLCTIGISILIAVAIFKLFKYMYVPYLGVILRVFSIIVIGVAIVLGFVNISIDDEHKITKNNITFKSLTHYYRYKIIQYARKKLGTFLLNPNYFSEWQKASNPWKPKESYWLYTFLPEKENPEFKEKYGFLTSSKYFSIDDIREEQRKIEEKNKKIHNEVRNRKKNKK